jgi:hypothetical protein
MVSAEGVIKLEEGDVKKVLKNERETPTEDGSGMKAEKMESEKYYLYFYFTHFICLP